MEIRILHKQGKSIHAIARPLRGPYPADNLFPRAPRWSEEGISVPADLSAITVPQHDLSIYDLIGRAS